LEQVFFTLEMGVVFATLAFTIFLFVSEIIRIDLAAILVLVVIGMLSYLPGLSNIADVNHLFDGFASNAVISIIAVMIVGAGLDKTGIMNKVAATILKHGGSTETRILPIVSATVGFISSFLQNVGATALFLPVVSRISARTGICCIKVFLHTSEWGWHHVYIWHEVTNAYLLRSGHHHHLGVLRNSENV
jgi:di/tricarboxylate transporter